MNVDKKCTVCMIENDHNKFRADYLESKGIETVNAGFSVDSIALIKNQSNLFILMMPDSYPLSIKGICLYIRDLCLEEDKTLFICAGDDVMAEVKKDIPKLFITGTYRPSGEMMMQLSNDILACFSNNVIARRSILMIDSDLEYMEKMNTFLEDKFSVTLIKPDMGLVNRHIAYPNVIVIGMDSMITVWGNALLFAMVERWQKLNDLKLVFLAKNKGEQQVFNYIKIESATCISKETPPRKNAAYLINNYASEFPKI